MLDMLMSLNSNLKTPLHLAIKKKNTKSINLIMTYMAVGC